MSDLFTKSLRLALNEHPFNLTQAENLSYRIHAAKEKGYEVGCLEDRLWVDLMNKIMSVRREN